MLMVLASLITAWYVEMVGARMVFLGKGQVQMATMDNDLQMDCYCCGNTLFIVKVSMRKIMIRLITPKEKSITLKVRILL